MPLLEKCLLISLMLAVSTTASAYQEFPFCPSGGPPGWMNYFDYKRDKHNWQNHLRNINYQRYYSVRPEQNRSFRKSPANNSAYPARLMKQHPIPNYHYPSYQNRRFYNQRVIKRN